MTMYLTTLLIWHSVVVAFLADRLKWRGPFILICLPLAIIGASDVHLLVLGLIFAGYIMAVTAKSNEVRYIAVFFIAAGV